jgi:hypothetical protein
MALFLCCSLPGPGAAADSLTKETEDLAFQVQQIFRRSCAECHYENAPRERVNLFKTAVLEERGLIHRGAPDDSELLDRVAGGIMPPASRVKLADPDVKVLREWIKQGAPAPLDGSQGYALWCIKEDLERIEQPEKKDIPYLRYLTFEHLYRFDGRPLPEFMKERREKLEAVLARFSRNKPHVSSIDPAAAVVRINLKELGWDAKPYPREIPNLYDLILLEYPDGELPISFLRLYRPLRNFLKMADQVRPVVVLPADWFMAALQSPPLADDFNAVLAPDDSRRPEAPTDLPRMPPPASERTAVRLRIDPIDALTREKVSGIGQLEVELGVIYARDRGEERPAFQDKIVDGDAIDYWVRTNKDAVVEFYKVSDGRTIEPLHPCVHTLEGKTSYLGSKLFGAPIVARRSTQPSKPQQLLVFAYPKEHLGETSLPTGVRLRAPRLHDRIYHPLYELPDAGDNDWREPKPGYLLKKSVSFTIEAK